MPSPSVLLVEDKDSLRTMLRLALEAQGHAVVEARDESEARKSSKRLAGAASKITSKRRPPAASARVSTTSWAPSSATIA